MEPIEIYWPALLAAVVARQALGALWYSPVLFIKQWCRLTGVAEAEMKAGFATALILDAIGGIVMAYVLANAILFSGVHGPMHGAFVGFFSWLGFAAVATLPSVTFERRPFGLYAINNGFLLLALIVMGAILASWRG
jgi:hypothetical protein